MLNKVTVVGTGSWATALVKLISDNGTKVNWLARKQTFVDHLESHGRNPAYLPQATFNMDMVMPTVDPVTAIQGTELVIFAVPSAYLEATLRRFRKESLASLPIAVSIKGFIPGTGFTPGCYVASYLDKKHFDVMVIGGPCHAEEIASHKSTYVTIGAADKEMAERLSQCLGSHYIHTVLSDDPSGIEYAAILKNIVGVACGLANGLHYGDNFQAVLVSNAMREADSFIKVMQPGGRDLFQSAYFGDLLVTAYSEFSRNRMLGKLVGRGMGVSKALQAMQMIAEGFYASREIAPLLRRLRVNLPVINTVYRVLHKHANPFHEFKLLERQLV